jgi:6-phosphogluconolactonase (cycloisomerase 2 family)
MRGPARLAVVAFLGSALAAAPDAVAAGNAYVTNDVNPGAVRPLDYGSAGLLAPMAPPTVDSPSNTRYVAITPNGRTLYATGGTDQVAIYDLSADGAPTPRGTVTAGSAPWGAVVAPDGHSLYVANSGDPETISQFDVLPDGSLAAKTPASVPLSGTGSRYLAVSPDGAHLYIAHSGTGGMSQFDIDGAGRLTPKTPATVAGSPLSVGFALTPDGRSLYLPVAADHVIYQFDIGSDGALTPKNPPSVPANDDQLIVVSADGRSAYGTGAGSFVSQYDVGSGGVLLPKTPAFAVAPARVAGWLAVTPDGRSLYLTGGTGDDPTRTYQFDIGANGLLAQKSPSSVVTGAATRGIAVRPMQSALATFAAAPVRAGAATAFDATESRDPNAGTISRYDWDFGDGSSAPDGGATPTHVYGAPGTYNVILHVTGTGGCNQTVFNGMATLCNGAPATRTRAITVPASAPSPGFSVVSRRANRRGIIRLVLLPTAAGRFAATATGKRGGRRVTYGKGKATARGTRAVTLRIRPSRAGRALRRRARSLKLSIKIVFTPASNTTRSRRTTITLRGGG